MSERLTERQQAFTYHRPSQDVQRLMTTLRVKFIDLVTWIDGDIPESRQKSLAITALEESAMWAMKALAVTDVGGAVVDPPSQA